MIGLTKTCSNSLDRVTVSLSSFMHDDDDDDDDDDNGNEDNGDDVSVAESAESAVSGASVESQVEVEDESSDEREFERALLDPNEHAQIHYGFIAINEASRSLDAHCNQCGCAVNRIFLTPGAHRLWHKADRWAHTCNGCQWIARVITLGTRRSSTLKA